ncbi:tetratricopeptide repeat protein [Vampirovibrio chlorellavorus]|uniref:tetratricopeptide repeat protein n=1 Tax=Vampirovibrio chlorellavorus TaxID=758823 RepID=UPI0026EF376D|nr:tetratricopeptide repeat protein [Vampirovibrio chlorellavorus]
MTAPPIFISPGVIERIENGSFIPSRRAKPSSAPQERRNVLSPLTVTKRCIRYEPHVFTHRKPLILKLARALNQAETKIVLVGGPQGCGKTSLVRGLIELMGSHNEQLLWFDVNRHSDFEEIIQFLIHYITYVCDAQTHTGQPTSPSNALPEKAGDDPLKRLEKLIVQVSGMPLLLVLDNVEYIVDPELRFNSYPFKEMLNFLLTFPNIKMVLIGERLPHADMSPNQEGVSDIHLEGLPQAETVTFLESLNPKPEALQTDAAVLENMLAPQTALKPLQGLWQKTEGQPWLLQIIQHLNRQTNLDFATLNRLLENTLEQTQSVPTGQEPTTLSTLISLIYQRLPDQQRRLFQVMAFLRHPVDPASLLALTGLCFPVLGPTRLEKSALQYILEHSLLRDLLKISYPPQEVLEHIRKRHHLETGNNATVAEAHHKKFSPWYELYHRVRLIIYSSLPAGERERLHGVLQDFYRQERTQEPEHRILKIKNRALLAEAKYHSNAARERKTASTGGLISGMDEPPLSTKTYLAGFKQPVGPVDRPLTLSDYKNINLPEPVAGAGSEETPTPTPEEAHSFLHLLRESSQKPFLPQELDELGLSDEEKRLLQQHKSLGELLQAEVAASEALSPNPPGPLTPPEPVPTAPGDVLSAVASVQAEDEQEKIIQSRLASAVAAQNHSLIAQELIELARYRASHGRYESAGSCLQKALSLKGSVPKDVMAEAYRLNGTVNKQTYHHNSALSNLLKAAEQIRKLMYEDDTVDAVWLGRLGQVYQDLGEIYAYRKQSPQAIEAFQHALRWYQSADNPSGQAEIHFQLAGVHDDQGDLDAAIEAYQKALSLDEALGNPLSAAATLTNLSLLYQDKQQWSSAQECLQKALKFDQDSQNTEGQFNTLERLCKLQRHLKNWPQAQRYAQQGLSLSIQNRSALWQAQFYTQLGQLCESQGQWAQAIQNFQLALSSGANTLADESLRWLSKKVHELHGKG